MVGRIGGTLPQPVASKGEAGVQEAEMAVASVQAISNTENRGEEERALPLEKARQMIGSMNNFLEGAGTQLRFRLHDELNEYYVTIVDSQTDEVVREIPSKKLMDIHAAMKEFVGLLIDRKI